MTDQLWTEVDKYLTDLFIPPDAALDNALASSQSEGLQPINVSPEVARSRW